MTAAQDTRHSPTRSHTTAMKESLDPKLRDRDDQTISRSDAVLRRMHRLNFLGQTETQLDYVLGRTTAKITERCLQTRVFKLRLGKVHSPRASLIRQRHIRVSSQMINIPFLLVRIDSEKHDDSTLSRRLLTEIVREIDEGSFISKAIPDRAGSCEKEIPARRTCRCACTTT